MYIICTILLSCKTSINRPLINFAQVSCAINFTRFLNREKIDAFAKKNSVISDDIAEKLAHERLYLDISSEICMGPA